MHINKAQLILNKLREENGLNDTFLAELMHVHRTYINYIRTGKRNASTKFTTELEKYAIIIHDKNVYQIRRKYNKKNKPLKPDNKAIEIFNNTVPTIQNNLCAFCTNIAPMDVSINNEKKHLCVSCFNTYYNLN